MILAVTISFFQSEGNQQDVKIREMGAEVRLTRRSKGTRYKTAALISLFVICSFDNCYVSQVFRGFEIMRYLQETCNEVI